MYMYMCVHTHIQTHTLAPRSVATEMVGVEVSIEPLSVNFTIEFVSKVDSTFATVSFFIFFLVGGGGAKMDWL